MTDADRKMGSIGILLPNLEARLVEDDDGKTDAREGEPGELWINPVQWAPSGGVATDVRHIGASARTWEMYALAHGLDDPS